jgi:hypothetical protein
MDTKPLFVYEIPNAISVFMGTEKAQIINTIRYYKDDRRQDGFKIPSESEIKNLERIIITCGFPMMHKDHFISVEVRKNVIFSVNANFYEYIKELSQGYEHLKRADLYKFQAGAESFGLFFLPEYVMEGIRDYDWSQHEEQMSAWIHKRTEIIEEGVRKGVLYVPKVKKIILPVVKGSDSIN